MTRRTGRVLFGAVAFDSMLRCVSRTAGVSDAFAFVMNPSQTAPDLAAVVQEFALLGHYQSGAPYGSGHINDTFAVVLDQAGTPVRYILQRVNDRVFKNVPHVMENIQRVTTHATKRAAESGATHASRRSLTLVPARSV